MCPKAERTALPHGSTPPWPGDLSSYTGWPLVPGNQHHLPREIPRRQEAAQGHGARTRQSQHLNLGTSSPRVPPRAASSGSEAPSQRCTPPRRCTEREHQAQHLSPGLRPPSLLRPLSQGRAPSPDVGSLRTRTNAGAGEEDPGLRAGLSWPPRLCAGCGGGDSSKEGTFDMGLEMRLPETEIPKRE